MELQAPSRRGILLALIVLAVAASGLPPALTAAPRDSVAVRVYYKEWGGELESCTGLNWGWDSLTRRMASGDSISVGLYSVLRGHFTLGKVISPDSAWLAYPPSRLVWDSQGYKPSDYREPNWVLLTTRPAPFRTYGIRDAEGFYRVRLVMPWPEPSPKPVRTSILRGRVVDDSTGCAVFFCQVVVDWTKCTARTDTLGQFSLVGVPVGEAGVNACAPGWVTGHSAARVPGDAVVIRLRRDPRARVIQPCWGHR